MVKKNDDRSSIGMLYYSSRYVGKGKREKKIGEIRNKRIKKVRKGYKRAQ